MLLHGNGGHVHPAHVGDLVGHRDLLILLGCGGLDIPGHFQLRVSAGIGDPLGEVLGLVDQLPVLVVDGVFDLEGDPSGLELRLGHLPLALPALRRSDAEGGIAKFFHLFPAGIVQRDRTRHVAFAHIGHGDGDRDFLRFGKLVGLQAHGHLERILRQGRAGAEQREAKPQYQRKKQLLSFHVPTGPFGPCPLS